MTLSTFRGNESYESCQTNKPNQARVTWGRRCPWHKAKPGAGPGRLPPPPPPPSAHRGLGHFLATTIEQQHSLSPSADWQGKGNPGVFHWAGSLFRELQGWSKKTTTFSPSGEPLGATQPGWWRHGRAQDQEPDRRGWSSLLRARGRQRTWAHWPTWLEMVLQSQSHLEPNHWK